MKRLLTTLLATALITYAVLFAYLAQAETLNLVMEVPATLDVTAREKIIDTTTGLQATEPGTDKIDFITCSNFPDITDPQTGEVMPGGIDISTCSTIPLSGVLLWGDYLIGNGAAYELYRMVAEWPPVMMPGTQIVSNKKLILAKIEDGGSTDPLAMVDALFTVYELPWVIVGLQDFYNSPGYCSDVLFTNETDCTDNLATWTPEAPNVYLPIDQVNFKYLNPRPVWDCSTEPCVETSQQTAQCNWFALWAGAAEWVCN